MNLKEAISSKDYEIAIQLGSQATDEELYIAIDQSNFLQNSATHIGEIDFYIFLDSRGILSLDYSKRMDNAKDSEEFDFENIKFEDLIKDENKKFKINHRLTEPLPYYLILRSMKELSFCIKRNTDDYNDRLENLLKIIKNCRNLHLEEGVIMEIALVQGGLPLEIIEHLIDAGCNPLIFDRNDENYIFKSVDNLQNRTDLLKEYLNLFIEKGVDINHKNIVGDTPILQAINKKICLKTIRTLIDLGADTNIINSEGDNLIEIATLNQNTDLIKELLDIGFYFDHERLDKKGKSLLYRYLIKHRFNEKLESLSLLLEDQPDLFQLNKENYYSKKGFSTPINILATQSNIESLKAALILVKPNLNQVDEYGDTVLHNATRKIEPSKKEYRKQLERIKILVSYGIDINIRNNENKTAIDVASEDNNRIEIVEYLMSKIS